MNTRTILPILTLALVASAASIETGADKAPTPATARMKITIKTNNKVLTATLDDNPTARAFANLLPLDLGEDLLARVRFDSGGAADSPTRH